MRPLLSIGRLLLHSRNCIQHNTNFTIISRSFQAKTDAVSFEISNGVGGIEAMLFAEEMLSLYEKFFMHMRWTYNMIEHVKGDKLGGLQSAKLVISGPRTFEGLIQEAGTHRVQRVPATERSGRMHTSTVAVSVVPKSVLDIKLKDKDLEYTAKRASGPGGQFVNKTDSAVRLVHRPTGLAVESQESRHQMENKKIAMRKLLDKIKRIELEKITSQMTGMKRAQIGNADRSDKIRTYNFPQDRITDHRIGKNYHNLRGLFDGDITILEKMISDFHSQ